MDSDPAHAHNKIALDAIRRIVRTLRVTDRDVEKRLGISVAQLFVLELLVDHGSASIGDLAAATMTDPSSVSVVVKRLVDGGMATREPAPEDARRAVICATPRGRKTLARAPEAPQGRLVAALEALSPAEQQGLAEALTHVADWMGKAEPAFFFEDEHGPDAAPEANAAASASPRSTESARPASPAPSPSAGSTGSPRPAARRTAPARRR